ncbi:PepSY domain-containing protein [Streptomyces sp. NPDC059564]|uniref:PepSY domain-containing protein n=1 Tax=Streptomyces sp. NPDC059564 TaxID=3346865 RepID=UPI00367BDE4B
MKRTLYALPAATAAALLLTCPAGGASAASAGATGSAAHAAAARADVDAAGAAAAALKKYPGYVESLDKDGTVWHVNVIGKNGKSHSEVEVSSSGAATRRNQDSDDDGNEYKSLIAAKVGAAKAMKTALAAHPGKVWSLDWDDDNDNGVADHWSVEVKSASGGTQNVGIDAKTGKVVAADSDNDGNSDGNDDGGDNG